MNLKINSTNIKTPKFFQVTVLDIDSENTIRTADGSLTRDRIAVKRQIDIEWETLTMTEVSTILSAISGVFFNFYYPDPQEGSYATRSFYVGNRPAPIAIEKNGQIIWENLKMTFTQR